MKRTNARSGRGWRRLRNTLLVLLVLLLCTMLYFKQVTRINPPEITDMSALEQPRVEAGPDFWRVGNNWLKKNDRGLWEMYLEGNPFEMGVANGKLTRELIAQQESAFVEQINTLIPSPGYLRFLHTFTAWFNRDLDEYIPEEYKEEIYGVSFSAADGYEFIGPKYDRMLNYHAAHDIGHALQSLMLVGCTSFAANFHTDSALLIGRNFDFYINPAFAENKIVAFVHPDEGIDFVYITWASMIGVVSGMNTRGLTVTINAAKSDIPFKAAMPISLLAREILQHAGNIDEAVAIARKRTTFVAESLLIGSGEDNRAVIIEKSPARLDVYEAPSTELVCANHFQGEAYADDANNLEYMATSATVYRQQRCTQLMDSLMVSQQQLSPDDAAVILRDHRGIDGMDIGLGNEKAMAQMISHHSVIFEPRQQLLWVSTAPWQLGPYLAYHLNRIMAMGGRYNGSYPLCDSTLTIGPDPLLESPELNHYLEWIRQRDSLKGWISHQTPQEPGRIDSIIQLNPHYYQGWVLAGNYWYTMGDTSRANHYYRQALDREMENTVTREMIENRLREEKR